MALNPFLTIFLKGLGPVIIIILKFEIVHGLSVILLTETSTAHSDISKIIVTIYIKNLLPKSS